MVRIDRVLISRKLSGMSERIRLTGSHGEELSGRLELPAGKPTAFALFAHCFTCSKDIAAASRVSRALTKYGIAVLRFDFTGLGNSDGDFESTNFSSNVEDLILAAHYLEEHYEAPRLLIGHSLGGAAVLRAALKLPSVQAIATIGAPADPEHVTHLLTDSIEQIESEGKGHVQIGGREFTIRKDFLDDLRKQSQAHDLSELTAAKLILHSPIDDTVGVENARELYDQLRHPKSFISLDGADHMLSSRRDSEYVASILAAWANRYLEQEEAEIETPLDDGKVLIEGKAGSLRTKVVAGDHIWTADEPERSGGTDVGPNPYDMLLGALGACTSMTLQMYAQRKKIPLEEVSIVSTHERVQAKQGERGAATSEEASAQPQETIKREIRFIGDLTDEQRTRLTEIANKCPVHRTLSRQPHLVTEILE